jgi:uncharacterized delta-60 repeat protein
MWRRVAVRLACVTLITPALARADGTAGGLDPTFGDGGVAVASQAGQVFDVAVQVDGKVLAVGYDTTGSTLHWRVRRFGADGTIDASYGVSGSVALFASQGGSGAYDAALDASGRLVVVGAANVTVGTGRKATTQLALTAVRLHANGLPDSSFGTNGVVHAVVPATTQSDARAVAVLSDGKVVVAGVAKVKVGKATNDALVLARFTASGVLDASFGSGGTAVVSNGFGLFNQWGTLAVQADGRLVLGGTTRSSVSSGNTSFSSGWAVMRFSANGAVDGLLGAQPTTDHLRGCAVDANGRVVGVGYRTNGAGSADTLVVRHLSSGTLDATFGSAGVAVVDLDAYDRAYSGPLLPADGTIVLAATLGASHAPAVTARLLDDGSLDSGYGLGGVGTPVDLSPASVTIPWGLDLAPDGRIVMGGTASGTGTTFVARYDAE